MMLCRNWLIGVAISLVLAIGYLSFPLSSSDGFIPRQSTHRTSIRDDGIFRRIILNQNGDRGLRPLQMGRRSAIITKQSLEEHWFPLELLNDDEPRSRGGVEKKSLELCANLIRNRLNFTSSQQLENSKVAASSSLSNRTAALAKGKFLDLTCSVDGESILERLFQNEASLVADDTIILGAIMALQSLLVLGTQYGVRGTPEQLQRYVSHLKDTREEMAAEQDFSKWDASDVRRLKFQVDRTAGVQLLAELKWKRTPQGACDLLVAMGVWQKNEDLALLRSGFSLRFSGDEFTAARSASTLKHDPDMLLGLRQDLRDQKVYTIDSASTAEIDDGLAVEVIKEDDGKERLRYWIHIADADRWAPRDSPLFEVARQRATSLYLPQCSIHMFPSSVSTEVMSLKANKDVCALSLGVELADDGSIIDSSIVVTPSHLRVSYRLTYDDVDEMLEEGAGYLEEWQLGALLAAALKRRDFRIKNGSSEAFVPTQIPQYNVATFADKNAPDGIGIQLKVQVSHNGGKNQSVVTDLVSSSPQSNAAPVSSASTLVTEMMILAGEALGKWKIREDDNAKRNGADAGDGGNFLKHSIRLPFRTQPKPDFRSRSREQSIMMDLLSHNIGEGYCHAWYARRFLSPVKVREETGLHSGLGIACYVQLTSPIRRFTDLQVHCVVKRYLRRQAINDIMKKGGKIPDALTATDLGCHVPVLNESDGYDIKDAGRVDKDIDYSDRAALLGAARTLQRESQRYWLLELIRRRKEANQSVTYDSLVLGCVDPERRQYAVYIYDLGFECRYSTPVGSLRAGTILRLKVTNVIPRSGLITLTRAA